MPHTEFTTREIKEVKLEELPRFFKENWKRMWPEPNTPYIKVVHGDQKVTLRSDLVQFVISRRGEGELVDRIISNLGAFVGGKEGS